MDGLEYFKRVFLFVSRYRWYLEHDGTMNDFEKHRDYVIVQSVLELTTKYIKELERYTENGK